MRATVAAVAALAAIAQAVPQGVTSAIAPSSSAPAGCSLSVPGTFQITVVNVTRSAKRSLQPRDVLTLKLNNGVLTDAQNRIGYIASNYQFQFDGPPQAGSIFTAGFSVCQNSSLALGGSAIFYQCLSGDFYNLYDRNWAPQCSPIYIEAMGASGGSQPSVSVSQRSDGQPLATMVPVTQRTDGQVYASTAAGGAPIGQIGDGQLQAPTGRPPVSQIGDGQIQNPTGRPPVTQIGDGQIQNPTGRPVSQISDGQPQAPRPTASSRPAVSQISDGQIQAPTRTPVSQISDGQIQAPTAGSSRAPVTQISDGQIQAPTGVTSSRPVQFTGAAAPVRKGDAVAVVAGVAAALAML